MLIPPETPARYHKSYRCVAHLALFRGAITDNNLRQTSARQGPELRSLAHHPVGEYSELHELVQSQNTGLFILRGRRGDFNPIRVYLRGIADARNIGHAH